jgi:hypothetical protein
MYIKANLAGWRRVAHMWRLYKTGIGFTTGFIRSHTVTHNYSVYTLQLTTVDHNTRLATAPQPVFHCTVFFWRSLHSSANWLLSVLVTALTAGWRPSYIAREHTTKKTPPPHCCLGTDPVENAAFPLLRSRLGSDHIKNMSRSVCLATVLNTCHNIFQWIK